MAKMVTTDRVYLFKFEIVRLVTQACNSSIWKAEAETLYQFEIS